EGDVLRDDVAEDTADWLGEEPGDARGNGERDPEGDEQERDEHRAIALGPGGEGSGDWSWAWTVTCTQHMQLRTTPKRTVVTPRGRYYDAHITPPQPRTCDGRSLRPPP